MTICWASWVSCITAVQGQNGGAKGQERRENQPIFSFEERTKVSPWADCQVKNKPGTKGPLEPWMPDSLKRVWRLDWSLLDAGLAAAGVVGGDILPHSGRE